ncbi:MAG: ABC-F family ATP-binding cassette domain-containing protein [Proteobacteria bacterium]|nr:MAG: ABC-F family ATP-binding cassette domain-containing protein [Pseudomonadota bacterium]
MNRLADETHFVAEVDVYFGNKEASMRKPIATLVIERLHYTVPDSTDIIFRDASLHAALGKVALLGENGSGKSTLLSLIAGQISPFEGQIHLPASILLLEQSIIGLATAWDVIGLRREADIIQSCLRGNGSAKDLEAADSLWTPWNDWLEIAAEFGFDEDSLGKPLTELSPGQKQRLLFVKALIRDPDVLLLDEPTNHLDREGREQVLSFIRNWKKALILATHDRELLEAVDAIVVLEQKRLRLFTGSYQEFEEDRRRIQAKREHDLQSAEQSLKKTLAVQRQSLERQQKRSQRTAANSDKLGLPKILLGARKENAENTSAKLAEKQTGKVEDAKQKRKDSQSLIIEAKMIAMDLPTSASVKGRMLIEAKGLNISFDGKNYLWTQDVDFCIKGGERWQIFGANGSGKSSLLKLILGELPPSRGQMIRRDSLNIIYLDQELSLLDRKKTVLENARRLATQDLTDSELGTRLARVGLGGDNRFKLVTHLSGGERMRLALACLFSASASPDLMILDEPTNHLDLSSMQELESGFRDFKGALVLVTHDRQFAEAVACRNFLNL